MHRDSRVRMRALNKKDWSAWKSLRLKALKNAPEAFASSFEEESQWPDERFKEVLAQNHIFGFFIDEQLAGIAGFYVMNQPKTKHRGVIWGVYVQPECRGMNMANRLLMFLIGHAKSYVTQLHLTCVTTNQAAIRLYEKLGFTIIGTEPRSLKIGEDFFDEHSMVLQWTKRANDEITEQAPKEVTWLAG